MEEKPKPFTFDLVRWSPLLGGAAVIVFIAVLGVYLSVSMNKDIAPVTKQVVEGIGGLVMVFVFIGGITITVLSQSTQVENNGGQHLENCCGDKNCSPHENSSQR